MKNTFFSFLFFLFISPVFSQQTVVEKTYPDGSSSLVRGYDKHGALIKEISYYENGQIDYEGEFKEGKEHGKWTYYYKDGQKMYVEIYKNGFEEGKHYEWAPDGQLVKIEYYQQGRLVKTEEK